MDNYLPYDYKFFERYKLTPPSVDKHGTEDDIRKNMKQLKPKSWKLEGNKLIGMTDMGPLVQFIPTDYICKGTDDEGLPILVKVNK